MVIAGLRNCINVYSRAILVFRKFISIQSASLQPRTHIINPFQNTLFSDYLINNHVATYFERRKDPDEVGRLRQN